MSIMFYNRHKIYIYIDQQVAEECVSPIPVSVLEKSYVHNNPIVCVLIKELLPWSTARHMVLTSNIEVSGSS